MFSLVAFQEAEPSAAAVAENVAAVPDQHVRIDDDLIYIAALNQIMGVYCGGAATLLAAYLASPSLRRLANYQISPIELVGMPVGDCSFELHPESPLPLESNEGMEVIVTDSAGVATVNTTVGVWLCDGIVTSIAGEIFHVRATATIVEVVNTWVNTEIDFDQTLPVGRYQIVGARCWIDDGVLFRFVPIGEAHRPGGLCSGGVDRVDHRLQRNGGLGAWCEFDQITPPSVEILANEGAAGTAVEMYLDLIKIA